MLIRFGARLPDHNITDIQVGLILELPGQCTAPYLDHLFRSQILPVRVLVRLSLPTNCKSENQRSTSVELGAARCSLIFPKRAGS